MTSVDIYYRVLLLLLLHHVNYLYVSQYCLSLTLFQAYKVLANNDTPWVQEADRHAMTLMQTMIYSTLSVTCSIIAPGKQTTTSSPLINLESVFLTIEYPTYIQELLLMPYITAAE